MNNTQRWMEMGEKGAAVFSTNQTRRVPVGTLTQAKAFFRDLARAEPLGVPISTTSKTHVWLTWLLCGYRGYAELCPHGIEYFLVHTNESIGHTGQARVFLVKALQIVEPQPFSYLQALRGGYGGPPRTARVRRSGSQFQPR